MININPSLWLYTIPFFLIARLQVAFARCIFRRDLVVSCHPFVISDIHDLSGSPYGIDKCHGTPAGQVPVHLSGIDNQRGSFSPYLRVVGMAIHQQVKRTGRF